MNIRRKKPLIAESHSTVYGKGTCVDEEQMTPQLNLVHLAKLSHSQAKRAGW